MNSQTISTKPKEKLLTPIPREADQPFIMSFPDAMREIIKGKKVRRLEWTNESDHCLLKDTWLSIYINGGFHVWKISDGDMEGKDWIIVEI